MCISGQYSFGGVLIGNVLLWGSFEHLTKMTHVTQMKYELEQKCVDLWIATTKVLKNPLEAVDSLHWLYFEAHDHSGIFGSSNLAWEAWHSQRALAPQCISMHDKCNTLTELIYGPMFPFHSYCRDGIFHCGTVGADCLLSSSFPSRVHPTNAFHIHFH